MNYHYNKRVKNQGMISEEVKVSIKMIKLIDALQVGLTREIARKNIGIETNPSSNYVIGRFKKYEGHPISKIYNLGLKVSEEEYERRSQLSVSINTK